MIDPALTEIAQNILAKRYLIRNEKKEVVETPKGLFHRVAKFIAAVEHIPVEQDRWTSIFYSMMASCEFEPNTPCLVNAGRPDGTGQLSACFVIPVPDSMDGIFTAIHSMALVQKTGGGTGFSFSRLRPEGDFVKSTSGLASGPCSFMEVFDFATERIKQGGVRRGANMGILRVDHPDIMRFIRLKRDPQKMQNFNVSVAITDAFMLALEAGKDYDIIHPTNKNVVGQLHAPTVWKAIVNNAHFIGDPGLWFIDRTNDADPLSESLGPVEATNPCQPAWATVLTPDGIRTFADVDVGSTIWSGQRWTKIVKKVATGVKPVHAYRTRAGTFYGTENHRVVQNGQKIEVRAADAIDAIVGIVADPQPNFGWADAKHVADGLVLGDGTFHRASGRVFLLAGPDEIGEYRRDPVGECIGEYRPGVKETAYEVKTSFKDLPLTYNRVVPSEYRHGNAVTVMGFLRGLYSANGSVVGNRVTLKAASFAVIEAVQQMLSSIGILSYYTINKAHDVEHANGVYTSRESYDLNIGSVSSRRAFAERVGFIQEHKREKLFASLDIGAGRGPKITYDIADVEFIGDEPVFDITVEADEHTYWTGGLLVSNCGEVPLRPYDACCLGSINLARFYVEKDTPNTKVGSVMLRHGSIDFDRLQRTVKHSVRFLDNMLTQNHYPIPEIADMTSKSRKIGLGVMGWADLLMQLGVPYAAPEARDLGNHVMGMINRWAVDASEALAVERGPFHHWDVSKWKKLGHLPRRHSTVTVIAPTGTISMIAGCSSGIEPSFGLSMTREQAGLKLLEVNPLVEKIARREGFWSDELSLVVRETGSIANAPGVPDHWREVFTIANELDMEAHVSMQATFQANTEDAVSKTINLKREATEADVERAYMLAWQKGCKGITVYRDGCRENQVLTTGVATKPAEVARGNVDEIDNQVDDDLDVKAQEEIARRLGATTAAALSPLRRRVPANGRRKGETLSRSTPFGTAHVTINEHPDDNEPFELFVRLGKSGAEVMAWSEALGRVASYMLSIPSSVPPRIRLAEVANQLSGIGGSETWGHGKDRVVSAPDAVAKTILTYLGKGDDTNVETPAYTKTTMKPKDLCPDCGQATLTFTQRCGLCTSCGFSKC